MARPKTRSRLINLASSLGNINTPNQYGKFVFENDYLTLDDVSKLPDTNQYNPYQLVMITLNFKLVE